MNNISPVCAVTHSMVMYVVHRYIDRLPARSTSESLYRDIEGNKPVNPQFMGLTRRSHARIPFAASGHDMESMHELR